jgi:hypothetical protein
MAEFDITKPYDYDLVKGGANEIRKLKEAIKLLLSGEHTFPAEGGSAIGTGIHNTPQRCIISDAFPTNLGTNTLQRGTLLFKPSTKRLYYYLPDDQQWYPAVGVLKRNGRQIGGSVSGNPYVYSTRGTTDLTFNLSTDEVLVVESVIYYSHSNWQYFEVWLGDSICLGKAQLTQGSDNYKYGHLFTFYTPSTNLTNQYLQLKVYSSSTAVTLTFGLYFWKGKKL